jgi:hypothetical protein
MNTPIPDDKMAVIKDAIFKGQKLAAIKHYREATGVGLAEAKNAVELLESQLRTNAPASFQKAKSSGCFSLVLILVIAIGGVLYFAIEHGQK